MRQFAVVFRGQMNDDDESDAGIGRQRVEQCLQRLDPARRRADAGDGRMDGDYGPFLVIVLCSGHTRELRSGRL